MAEQVLKAANNAALANDLIAQATDQEEVIEPAKIVSPLDGSVNLPGGFINADGEVVRTAEVRELNGKDEEAIAKANGAAKVFSTILSRATISLGGVKPTEQMLDDLLIGDRDEILLGIFKSTFGKEAELGAYCSGCKDLKIVQVDVDEDIKRKVMLNPEEDRTFMVKSKNNEFLVTLPTGGTQKKLLANDDYTSAEQATILLEQTVLEINGRPVITKQQVQNLGILDRRDIVDAISKRNVGPVFGDITVSCPDCEGEVAVPINLGTLFRF
jgi:hypothetical protein